MENKIVINYKHSIYIVNRRPLESHEQFYTRAWLLVKQEPNTLTEYNTALMSSIKKTNEIYLKYTY